jgi:DNA invertase Pin-like site-specific DNA recombinase
LEQQAIDTTTPAGKLMFQVTGAFAEFERSIIRQRVNAGLRRAVEQGKRLGRPRVSPAKEKRILSHLRKGMGILKTAKKFGVGTGTVQRMSGPFDARTGVEMFSTILFRVGGQRVAHTQLAPRDFH